MALFLATFVYALTVLRTIRSNDDSADFVPQLSVTIAYVLAVVSVGALVMFLAHLVRQIRVESLLDQVCGDTVTTAARMLRRQEDGDAGTDDPSEFTPPGRGVVIQSDTSGFLVEIDEADLLATAVRHDVVLRVDRPVGSPSRWSSRRSLLALPGNTFGR